MEQIQPLILLVVHIVVAEVVDFVLVVMQVVLLIVLEMEVLEL